MDITTRYKLNPDITENQLKDFGFRKFGSHRYTYKNWLHKHIIQFVVEVDLDDKTYSYQVYDVDLNSAYLPYYSREFGFNNVVKQIDRKINKILKEFVKENIFYKKQEKTNGKKSSKISQSKLRTVQRSYDSNTLG